MIWTAGVKAYQGTSVLSYENEVEVGSTQVVVVVEETLTVARERCSDRGGGLVVYMKVTTSVAYEVEYGAFHRAPMSRWQTELLGEEVHEIEVLVLDPDGEADVVEFVTEIDQVGMQECPG